MTTKTAKANAEKISGSQARLLKEAQNLLDRSRAVLERLASAETLEKTTKAKADVKKQSKITHQSKKIKVHKETKVASELTPQRAAELYSKGMSVNEIAIKESVTYSKVRKLLADSGTPVRDASARLKGRTRKSAS